MKYKFSIQQRVFHFKQPAGTSRGIYTTRTSWFIKVWEPDNPAVYGIGECAPLLDLSCDALENYEGVLNGICNIVFQTGIINDKLLRPYPSMLFGIETALLSLQRDGSTALSDTPFAHGKEGIPINGLVWMGNYDEMLERLHVKLQDGFKCVKLKIGAIDFEKELELIKVIRENFNCKQLQLRVDANGGFLPKEAMKRLEILTKYDIHSIEQPIRQHQWREMAELCKYSPLPIAFDEELIGINSKEMKNNLLDCLSPQYIVLKPSLHGGMSGTEEWIKLANERNIKSWITSALESNVGLNAIAHLAARVYGPKITFPQGLGTGQLFTDNIELPIKMKNNQIWYLKNS